MEINPNLHCSFSDGYIAHTAYSASSFKNPVWLLRKYKNKTNQVLNCNIHLPHYNQLTQLSRDVNFLLETRSEKTHNNPKIPISLLSPIFSATKQREHVKSNHPNPTFHQALHTQKQLHPNGYPSKSTQKPKKKIVIPTISPENAHLQTPKIQNSKLDQLLLQKWKIQNA